MLNDTWHFTKSINDIYKFIIFVIYQTNINKDLCYFPHFTNHLIIVQNKMNVFLFFDLNATV